MCKIDVYRKASYMLRRQGYIGLIRIHMYSSMPFSEFGSLFFVVIVPAFTDCVYFEALFFWYWVVRGRENERAITLHSVVVCLHNTSCAARAFS